jgi:YihY family inner membrane protein
MNPISMNEPSPIPGSILAATRTGPWPGAPSSRPATLGQETRGVWVMLCLAVKNFVRIGGSYWAGAFAFNAFFSLFPLMVLLVTIASSFVDRDRAGREVVACLESYVPASAEMQRQIVGTVAGVLKARGQAGAIAFLILAWAALQCFTTLICATNQAWGVTVHNWWRLPLKSLALLGITAGAVLLGIAVPMLMGRAEGWLFPVHDFRFWRYSLESFFIPLLVVFISLSLFYRLAPRRPTRFAEVWAPALCATVLLRSGESLFVIYLEDFARLNAVYAAFGGMVALLLWIYLSGCIFIFGACLCAGQAEALGQPAARGPQLPGG